MALQLLSMVHLQQTFLALQLLTTMNLRILNLNMQPFLKEDILLNYGAQTPSSYDSPKPDPTSDYVAPPSDNNGSLLSVFNPGQPNHVVVQKMLPWQASQGCYIY